MVAIVRLIDIGIVASMVAVVVATAATGSAELHELLLITVAAVIVAIGS